MRAFVRRARTVLIVDVESPIGDETMSTVGRVPSIPRFNDATWLVALVVMTAATSAIPWALTASQDMDVPGLVILALSLALVVLTGALAVVGRYHGASIPLIGLAAVFHVAIAASFFGAIHWQISAINPDAFSEPLSRVDAIYLSIGTLTTTGAGDIVALSSGARIAITGQMVIALVIVATVLAAVANAPRADYDRDNVADLRTLTDS